MAIAICVGLSNFILRVKIILCTHTEESFELNMKSWKQDQICLFIIELTPALADFKGPTIFICYRRNSVIANIENKENIFKVPKKNFCFRQILDGIQLYLIL